MSLRAGKAFLSALRSSDELKAMLGAEMEDGTLTGARIFYIARTEADENEDRIPYVIVMPGAITSEGNKDDYDAYELATVEVLIVAADGESLCDLAEKVKETIESTLIGDDTFAFQEATYSASAPQYDPEKPCYFLTLTYQCSTIEL